MSQMTKIGLICFIAGLVIGLGGMAYWGSRQYRTLKAHADSVSIASEDLRTATHEFSDSMKAAIATIEKKKQRVIVKAVADTASVVAAETLLVVANNAQDSIDVYKNQIEALKDVNRNLFQALALSNEQIQAERTRADSLQRAVDDLNISIQDLTKRIDKLHGTPKWLKISTEVFKDAGILYAGIQYGRRH